MMLWQRLAAIKSSKVEPSARLMLVMIAEHMADDRPTCWASVETLAEETGYCERQSRVILAALESRGLISRRWGEHKCRDITIVWPSLATAEPATETRGGRRTPAESATLPAVFAASPAESASGKDCHPDRQSLPPLPAESATLTGSLCPRTVHEPIHEPPSEQSTPPSPAVARISPALRIRTVALAAVEAIRQRPVNPDRCATDLKTISGLWAAEGKPDPDEFGADLLRVIAWARESTDPLAARDIRAEGWADGANRCRDLATICVRARWGARVDAARSWDARGRVDIVPRSRESDRITSNRPPPSRTKGEAVLESLLTINPNEVNPWLRPKQSAPPLPSSLAPDSTTLLPARQR
jgi:hypothetical protein